MVFLVLEHCFFSIIFQICYNMRPKSKELKTYKLNEMQHLKLFFVNLRLMIPNIFYMVAHHYKEFNINYM